MTPCRKKCPHVVHFSVPRDWFEMNSQHQKRYSKGGKKFCGCCGLLGRVLLSLGVGQGVWCENNNNSNIYLHFTINLQVSVTAWSPKITIKLKTSWVTINTIINILKLVIKRHLKFQQ